MYAGDLWQLDFTFFCEDEYLFRYAKWYISEMIITVDANYLWLQNHHMMLGCIAFNLFWSRMAVFLVRPHWLQIIVFSGVDIISIIKFLGSHTTFFPIRFYAMSYMFHGSLDYNNMNQLCVCRLIRFLHSHVETQHDLPFLFSFELISSHMLGQICWCLVTVHSKF